ncbi:hypothetical protein F4811DRAFT_401863 [Daldinia bambusicola]|nr:hypothetical protein F4811DRAFT_401863 [Daldinia bambusicola]
MRIEIIEDPPPYTRDAVVDTITPILGSHLISQDIGRYIHASSQVSLPRRASSQIRSWAARLSDNPLWIQGPAETPYPSKAMLTGLAITRQYHPSISHFCSTRPPSGGGGGAAPNTCREMLADMFKQLIVELVFALPDEIYTTIDLSASRFEVLAQPEVDVSAVLGLLKDVRLLSRHEEINCIIEGVQLLENRDDMCHTRNLERTLRLIMEIMKTCFTSDGYVNILNDLVECGRVIKVYV